MGSSQLIAAAGLCPVLLGGGAAAAPSGTNWMTSRVSVSAGVKQADSYACLTPAISGDGRVVVYESEATNLVPPDANQNTDAYLSRRLIAPA
ncbi:hypothetical protein [Paractinoplanes rishiriensis]|uniref:Uncharacterized protein n=1 Tax=Paractinoplanes rishiriensis TaxID=1050105 RepID=A0A919KAW7_9ACTN|nr:hypothetical protein [Actinoplanes rishiriensis]GIF01749.1 hypothetical protein Ari01nite_92130 [Actinoplanes rishiriensis]